MKFASQILAGMVAVVLLCSVALAQTPNVMRLWEKQYAPYEILELPGGDARVYYGGDIYHLAGRSGNFIIYVDAPQNARNRLIGFAGETYRVEFHSSNPNVATVDEYGRVQFLETGDVVFTVRAGGNGINIPVTVVDAPFRVDWRNTIPVDEFVEMWGFPDRTIHETVRWPDRSAIIEGFHMSFGGTSTVELEFWEYTRWPTLLIRVSRGIVTEVYQRYWDMSYHSLASFTLNLP